MVHMHPSNLYLRRGDTIQIFNALGPDQPVPGRLLTV